MDTIVRPPQTPTSEPEPARRGRRWVRVTVVVVLGIVALALTAGGIWLSRYDPFVGGSVGFTPRWADGAWFRTDFHADPADGASFTHYSSPIKQGGTFVYGFSIRNDGVLPVRITSVGNSDSGDVGDPLTTRAFAVDLDPYGGEPLRPPGPATDPTAMPPIEPFTLGSGEEAIVLVAAQTEDCITRGSSLTLMSVPIRSSVLGVQRTVWFEPNLQIELRGYSGCPG